jgi:hypothetical protein
MLALVPLAIAGCVSAERREARRRQDDLIDTRRSYDRGGNPNFDTQGNYQGCRGIGCEVDNPDDDN